MSKLNTYRPHLRADATSGFLVFLIALPLCLGIAMASGFPAVSGILTAVIGGLLTSFLGSAQLTIKGPAAGLIVIALGAVQELGRGDTALGYRSALACIAVAGALQVGLSLLRAGALADFFPGSVVHGMLAAIGVIIISKQAHVLLGVQPAAKSPLGLLAELPHSFALLNPEVACIGVLGLIILFGLPMLGRSWIRKVPAQMLVLVCAVPLALYFDLGHEHTYSFHAHSYPAGPKFLVQLPAHLLSAIVFPNFSQLFTPVSLKYIAMFTLVGSLESLLSTRAVDMLDPQHRRSDMDRDLFATGIGNVLSGMLGGLPMISEIVRSSANINAGATSRFSNFFHGLFLLLFIVLAPGLLQRIPLSALAAMLVYTGTRLASPDLVKKTLRIGPEQLALFMFTLLMTLWTDLLVGVAAGVLLKLALHLLRGAPLRSLFRCSVQVQDREGLVILRPADALVFSNYLTLRRRIEALQPNAAHVAIDLSETRLVDHTAMERLHHLREDWQRAGGKLSLWGLDGHQPVSNHALAARRKAAILHAA